MDESPISISSDCTIFLDKPPCCVKFVPEHPEYFIVGTYNLLPSEETSLNIESEADDNSATATSATPARDGSLMVCKLVNNEIILLSTTEVSYGVLDVHFYGSTTLIGVATSVGSFTVFELSFVNKHASPELMWKASFVIADSDTVVTSFAWDLSSFGKRICATLTTGEVILVSFPLPALELAESQTGDTPAAIDVLYTHSLEAWIATFTTLMTSDSKQLEVPAILSGGDDSVLACVIPQPEAPSETIPQHVGSDNSEDEESTAQSPPAPVLIDRRTHSAGVTAILPLILTLSSATALNPGQTHPQVLITGSYDDTLRVLPLPHRATNTPYPRRPAPPLLELRLPGGVWRLRLLSLSVAPTASDPLATRDTASSRAGHDGATATATLLVSCMYAGAFLVRLAFAVASGAPDARGDAAVICTGHAVLARFAEHESMCYACEAQPHLSDQGGGGSGGQGAVDPGGALDVGDDDGGNGSRRKVVSCSFYDRRVCLWRV